MIPDLAPITRFLRAKASSHLLVSAVHYLNVFEILSQGPLYLEELKQRLKLSERPSMVLFPALVAMDLLSWTDDNKLTLTATGKFLTTKQRPNLLGYTGLEKDDPGAVQLTQYLLNDGPPANQGGTSYVKDDESESPMDDSELSRYFTNALAGRAQLLSPIVAAALPKTTGHLLDVAAGTGFYTFEWLLQNPNARATVFDRPEVLKTSKEYLEIFLKSNKNADSLHERVAFLPGDMLHDELPEADILLAASLFHDWPTPVCKTLAKRFANAIKPGGSLWVHDVFLNDQLDGPITASDYSALLFLGTKGRIYSRKEHRQWFSDAGLNNNNHSIPTAMDYGLIWASKNQ